MDSPPTVVDSGGVVCIVLKTLPSRGPAILLRLTVPKPPPHRRNSEPPHCMHLHPVAPPPRSCPFPTHPPVPPYPSSVPPPPPPSSPPAPPDTAAASSPLNPPSAKFRSSMPPVSRAPLTLSSIPSAVPAPSSTPPCPASPGRVSPFRPLAVSILGIIHQRWHDSARRMRARAGRRSRARRRPRPAAAPALRPRCR